MKLNTPPEDVVSGRGQLGEVPPCLPEPEAGDCEALDADEEDVAHLDHAGAHQGRPQGLHHHQAASKINLSDDE